MSDSSTTGLRVKATLKVRIEQFGLYPCCVLSRKAWPAARSGLLSCQGALTKSPAKV